MEIRGSRVLMLGGSGLVGMAIVRELIPRSPAAVVVCGLTRPEAESAVRELEGEPGASSVRLIPAWGDIFAARQTKDRRGSEILADADARGKLLDDLYAPPVPGAMERSALGALLIEHEPQIVIDCINTATVLAYQNVYASAVRLRERVRQGTADIELVETHLATSYLPQLIRHVQLALEGMRRVGTGLYLKIGTSGTGGMGLNIPFTHSEERPSRVLLAKASLAGAHTMLLYLMARTPDAPVVKEIKPTAAISWKRIAHGEVVRGGRPLRRIDAARALPVEEAFGGGLQDVWRDTGENLHGVFLDAGENGLFSPPEFETLTALGLMEFITPEEIAQDVIREISGSPTGHDVVGALDASTSGPTYRAGVMRQFAVSRMDELEREHGVESVAYEMLGPPRLSKLLFEAAILSRLSDGKLSVAARLDPADTARRAESLIEGDEDLRTRIVSIGIPILLSDGRRVLRGEEVKVAPETGDERERRGLIENGWVDLRAENWNRWRERTSRMVVAVSDVPGADTGSRRDIESWHLTGQIRPGALAAWVFRHEDQGERIKR